ncbi:hypothetical protein [Rhizobium leguminosarum]|uniref:hypothetical protein n=1 Tax=Rhizobium leguminosarum TaxID=384 RepID=UPI003D0699BD
MRGSNQTVRNFEYAIGVGDLVVAALMHEELDKDLSPSDTALVAELEQRLCEYKDIEARHGSGSLLKLQISTVAHLARLGRISQDRIDAATRYAANNAT